MSSRSPRGERAARELEAMLRARGDGANVDVTERAGHLEIAVKLDDGTSQVLARATSIGIDQYGLSFRKHTGRWEPMPVSGDLRAIAQGITDFLAPYLDPDNLNA